MPRSLPVRANLDWLRKTAKDRLDALRTAQPDATLSDAQFAVARDYGFSSWRALKARVDEIREALANVTTGPQPTAEEGLAIAPDDPDLVQLLKAVRDGDSATAATLVTRRPALVRAFGSEGETALHVAASANDAKIGAYLLLVGSDPDAKFAGSAHNALSWAVTCDALDFAAAMTKLGARPDLFCAAGMGALDTVQSYFDESGALLPNASETGSSRYAEDGSRLPCPPAGVTEQISDALYMAARNGKADVVRFLLTKSPDLAFRAYDGATALHWAYFSGSQPTIELLLEAGADTTLRDTSLSVTPRAFGICSLSNWGFDGRVRGQLAADPSLAKVDDGTTPLHEAAKNGHLEIVKMLLGAGADPSRRDRDGWTPAELAKAKGHEALLALL